MKYLKRIILIISVLLIISYFIPARQTTFEELYQKQDKVATSLSEFRSRTTKKITIAGLDWTYLITGSGEKTILFLHGMGGSYDLWWQQINYFEKEYKIITYSLPEEINTLEKVQHGIEAILKTENVTRFYAIGTSMGGYITQYLLNKMPNRIEKAVLGNTFAPNNLIKSKNKNKIKIVPLLPEILIAKLAKKQLNNKILPAANNDSLLTAFLPSLPFSKEQFINRFSVVIDNFISKPYLYEIKRIPKLIITSNNDPLIEKELREDLIKLYPNTAKKTFNSGHFPYINEAGAYNIALKKFFDTNNEFNEIENVLTNYFNGRKNADINQLRKAFSKNAKLYTVVNGESLLISLSDYLDKVKEDGISQIETSILHGEINANTASYKTEFKYVNKTYQDYLTLLKTNNGWKIVSKTFTRIK